MAINYGNEYRKFRATQKKQREAFLAAGMSEDAISEIEKTDTAQFLSNIRFKLHTQPFVGDENDSTSPLLKKFTSELTVTIDTYRVSTDFGWLDEIENPLLLKALRKLSQEQLKLVKLFFIDGYGTSEVAEIMGLSPQSTCNRISRIKKNILKIFAEGV